MMRLITILILLLAGLPRIGVGTISVSADTGCNDVVCQPVVVESSCCDDPEIAMDMDEFCPMSGGPCRCGITSDGDRNQLPPAPFQRGETQITLGLSAESLQVGIWTVSSDEHSAPLIGLVWNLHALRTHTETQAILGIWIT